MEFKANTYYKMRNGCKAYVGYILDEKGEKYQLRGHWYDENSGLKTSDSWTREGPHFAGKTSEFDLISEWVEPAEEINVSEMLVGVSRGGAEGNYLAVTSSAKLIKPADRFIAIVTVKDWEENIKTGKRNLIVGEGL